MLDDLNQKIHRRRFAPRELKRTRLAPLDPSLPTRWEEKKNSPSRQTTGRGINFFFFLALGFFVLAVSVAGVIFWRGHNVVSNKDIIVEIVGPKIVKTGEAATFQLTLTNRSAAALEGAELKITYPPGSRAVLDGAPLLESREIIGRINPQETITRTLTGIFYGPERQTLHLRTSLHYRLSGASVFYEDHHDYQFALGASPVTVVVTTDPEIVAGDSVTLSVLLRSNVSEAIRDLALLAEYPPGFKFLSATPAPNDGETRWLLGDLEGGGERRIELTGRLSGQAEELKSFRFVVGPRQISATASEQLEYGSQFQTITLKQSFLGLTLDLNGEATNPYPTPSGGEIKGKLRWQNNLPINLNDLVIRLYFDGPALDRQNVKVNQGFYSSADNLITWNKNYLSDLAQLSAGSRGEVEFSFRDRPFTSNQKVVSKNPTINLRAVATAKRLAEGFAEETITTEVERQVRVESDFQLLARALRSQGPYQNTGPLPPKAETESTYTIHWLVTNLVNDVKEAKLSAVLPPFVKWKNLYTPADQSLSFDEEKRELVWDLGTIRAGTGPGQLYPARELFFQIGLLPSANQIGSEPVLISKITLSGTDVFTGTTLQRTKSDLTTRLTGDPNFTFGQEKVMP